MTRVIPALLVCALASCGAWPDVESPTGRSTSKDWPVLQPLADLTRTSQAELSDEETAETLSERAEALRRRAAILRSPVTDQDAFDALRARMKP